MNEREDEAIRSSCKKPKKIVIIGGCGHVGLPLGIVFANCGLDVVLLDRDQAKIDTVKGARCPSWKPTPWNSWNASWARG